MWDLKGVAGISGMWEATSGAESEKKIPNQLQIPLSAFTKNFPVR